jgi:hypothetical protein
MPAATPAAAKAPPRRVPQATPRPDNTDKGHTTTIEADGAVLANEPTPRTGKPAAKPRPRPSNAVRADDAVLAQ